MIKWTNLRIVCDVIYLSAFTEILSSITHALRAVVFPLSCYLVVDIDFMHVLRRTEYTYECVPPSLPLGRGYKGSVGGVSLPLHH